MSVGLRSMPKTTMGSGAPIAQLHRLREEFPFSCHGVGLSIGGEEDLDELHLKRLKTCSAGFSRSRSRSTCVVNA